MEGGLLAMACRAPRLWNADGLPSDLVVSSSLFEGTGFLQAAVPVPYQVSLTILQVISAGLFGQGAELHPDALFHLFCCERMSPALRFVLSENAHGHLAVSSGLIRSNTCHLATGTHSSRVAQLLYR